MSKWIPIEKFDNNYYYKPVLLIYTLLNKRVYNIGYQSDLGFYVFGSTPIKVEPEYFIYIPDMPEQKETEEERSRRIEKRIEEASERWEYGTEPPVDGSTFLAFYYHNDVVEVGDLYFSEQDGAWIDKKKNLISDVKSWLRPDMDK